MPKTKSKNSEPKKTLTSSKESNPKDAIDDVEMEKKVSKKAKSESSKSKPKKSKPKKAKDSEDTDSDVDMEDKKAKKSSKKAKSKSNVESKSSKSNPDDEMDDDVEIKKEDAKKGRHRAHKLSMKQLKKFMASLGKYSKAFRDAFKEVADNRIECLNSEDEAIKAEAEKAEAVIVVRVLEQNIRQRVKSNRLDQLTKHAEIFENVGATDQQIEDCLTYFKNLVKKRKKNADTKEGRALNGKNAGDKLAKKIKIEGEPMPEIPADAFKPGDEIYNKALDVAYKNAPFYPSPEIKKIQSLAYDHRRNPHKKRLTEAELKALDPKIRAKYLDILKNGKTRVTKEHVENKISFKAGALYADSHPSFPPDSYFTDPKRKSISKVEFKKGYDNFRETYPKHDVEGAAGLKYAYARMHAGRGKVGRKYLISEGRSPRFIHAALKEFREFDASNLSMSPAERRMWDKGRMFGGKIDEPPTEEAARKMYPLVTDALLISAFIDGCKYRIDNRERSSQGNKAYIAGYNRRTVNPIKPSQKYLKLLGYTGQLAIDYLEGWTTRDLSDKRNGRNPFLARAVDLGKLTAGFGNSRPVINDESKKRYAEQVGQKNVNKFLEVVVNSYDEKKAENDAKGFTLKILRDKYLGGRQGYKDARNVAKKPRLTMDDYVYSSNSPLWRGEYDRHYEMVIKARQAAEKYQAAEDAGEPINLPPEMNVDSASYDPLFDQGFRDMLKIIAESKLGKDQKESEAANDRTEVDSEADTDQNIASSMAMMRKAQSESEDGSTADLFELDKASSSHSHSHEIKASGSGLPVSSSSLKTSNKPIVSVKPGAKKLTGKVVPKKKSTSSVSDKASKPVSHSHMMEGSGSSLSISTSSKDNTTSVLGKHRREGDVESQLAKKPRRKIPRLSDKKSDVEPTLPVNSTAPAASTVTQSNIIESSSNSALITNGLFSPSAPTSTQTNALDSINIESKGNPTGSVSSRWSSAKTWGEAKSLTDTTTVAMPQNSIAQFFEKPRATDQDAMVMDTEKDSADKNTSMEVEKNSALNLSRKLI